MQPSIVFTIPKSFLPERRCLMTEVVDGDWVKADAGTVFDDRQILSKGDTNE